MSETTATAGGVVLTGAAIDFFLVRRLVSAFEMEARGMKMNRGPSALQQAKMLGLVPANCRSKRAGMEAAIAKTKEMMPSYEPKARTLEIMEGMK
jgi:hypothetical protein